MLKTLLVLCGVLVVSATGLQAQVRGAGAARPGSTSVARGGSVAAARPASTGRPAAYRGGYANHFGGGYANGHHYRGGHNYGRYYYLGGIPFFYPYDYYGFGYPYYGSAFGYGYGGYPNASAAYTGRVADDSNNGNPQNSGASLPEAVQRQLARRGYYKGSIDGQFGPASRDALTRFQRKQGLKETGKIDEPTLEALGFTDQH